MPPVKPTLRPARAKSCTVAARNCLNARCTVGSVALPLNWRPASWYRRPPATGPATGFMARTPRSLPERPNGGSIPVQSGRQPAMAAVSAATRA